ncbi:SRPBCC family protein [Rhodococcus sp. NPDC078407]|uniref:SRPBCC family protein n=1 Tax=Rhodococcus sp. NPDC078407 TaxID=3364509 RepID=UPI0037C8DE50
MNHEPAVASRHVSQVIRRTRDEVYAFVANPANLPRWAAGLAKSPVSIDGDRLLVESPMGQVTVRFVPHNDLGVLDHDVTLPSGTIVNNPVRVLGHPQGAEILFTVRQIELSDEEFERDLDMVAADLKRLAEVLEARSA